MTRLILFSPNRIDHLDLKLLKTVFKLGVDFFHLRTENTEAQLAEFLKNIPEKYYSKIKLHSHHALCNRFLGCGMHYKEGTFSNEVIYQGRSVSASCHSLEELPSISKRVNYVFYSPVFSSISKKGHTPNDSLRSVGDVVSSCEDNVVALGGITPARISLINNIPFYGVASLGYVWNSEDPVKAILRLKEALG